MSDSRQELTCPVCWDTFVNPVILKCTHNLCLDCAEHVYSFRKLQVLQKIQTQKPSQENEPVASSTDDPADATASIVCPVCGASMALESETGVKDLTENLVLRNILQELAADDKTCGRCSKSSAVKDCVQCMTALCSECWDTWHAIPAFKDHETTALGASKKRILETCPKHGKKMKIFCMDDQVLLCSHCVLCSSHKSHPCLPLPDAVESMKSDWANLVQQASKKQEWLLKMQESSSSFARQVHEDTTKVLEKVQRDVGSLISALESRRDTLVELLTSDMEVKDEIFALQSSTVSHLLSRWDKLLQAEKDAAADPAAYDSWLDDVHHFLESAEKLESKYPQAPSFVMGVSACRKQLKGLGSLNFAAPQRLGSLTQADTRKLVEAMKLAPGQSPLQLVFKASEDSYTFDKFRTLCKIDKPSLCVIYLKNGFIFGGYTSVGWNFSTQWKKDPKAFLFRLSDGNSRNIFIFRQIVQNGSHATLGNAEAVIWGITDKDKRCDSNTATDEQHDLDVCFNKNQLGWCSSYLGCSYQCPTGADRKTFVAGSSSHWSFQDIEVYQIL